MSALSFLYKTTPGRFLLKGLTAPSLSRAVGTFMDSSLSKPLIKPFIKSNSIPMEDYLPAKYRSFNEFFTREIKKEKRPICLAPSLLISPCDGLLSVYPISGSLVIPVKEGAYSVASLLRSRKLAALYEGGTCLVFRLCVDHYHRYSYIESGIKGPNHHIPGRLHTVRPIALRSRPVFLENSREFTMIKSHRLGKVIQMEVGAMLVGRIKNLHGPCKVYRGQEKGRFEYGGSTIIVLLQKGKAEIDPKIISQSLAGEEFPVKMGETIGRISK